MKKEGIDCRVSLKQNLFVCALITRARAEWWPRRSYAGADHRRGRRERSPRGAHAGAERRRFTTSTSPWTYAGSSARWEPVAAPLGANGGSSLNRRPVATALRGANVGNQPPTYTSPSTSREPRRQRRGAGDPDVTGINISEDAWAEGWGGSCTRTSQPQPDGVLAAFSFYFIIIFIIYLLL